MNTLVLQLKKNHGLTAESILEHLLDEDIIHKNSIMSETETTLVFGPEIEDSGEQSETSSDESSYHKCEVSVKPMAISVESTSPYKTIQIFREIESLCLFPENLLR